MKNSKLKILFDPQIFCAQVYGGVSRYFCELASHLSAANPRLLVKIVAPMYVNEYLRLVPMNIVHGFPAPQFIFSSATALSSYMKLGFRLLGFLLGTIYINLVNPEIIHQTYFYPIYLFRRRAKKVLTIYDMIHEKFPADFPFNDKTAKYKRLAATSVDHIICISESTRRDVIDLLGVDSHKTSVVYLGFNFFLPLSEVPEKLSSISRASYILYVGKRSGYKNFEKFIQAYSKSNRLSQAFNVICFGGGLFTPNELAFMDGLGINRDKIMQISGDDQFLGYLYKNASAFIYPSLYEGFGIPPLEAMSQGCPVVCSFTSSIPEVVGDAGEFFNPTDVLGISRAIENVVFDEIRASELKLLGERRLAKFSWDKCANETSEIYMNLLRRREVTA